MGIYVPLELMSGILFMLIALGQLIRPFRFRNFVFSLILFEMGGLHLLHLYIIYNRDSLTYYTLFPLSIPVFMSLGVLIYLFILSVREEVQNFDRKIIKHFIPAFVSVLSLIIFYLVTGIENICARSSFLCRFFINAMFIISWCSLAGYLVLSIYHIKTALKKGNPVHRVFRQLMFLLFVSFPAMITGIITSVLEWPSNSPLNMVYLLINTFIIFALFLLTQRNPYLIQYGTLPGKKKSEEKTDNAHLANIDIENLTYNLVIIMEEERLYCDEDLTLGRLSEALEVTSHQLSRYLNEYHQKNFNNYVNEYRINEAMKMLLEEPERSTLSIAYAVGFNSYSVFYTAFKKHTELSPARFRKEKAYPGK